ncbi:TetR/AcrR family transcriptional regulator [Cytophaga hutchinsonii]|jgi:TetR/AcrR family transcriptional repressor of nem operon|uniref:Transcriptional regulator, TetR family n=1 Tax=Cytophaga hutchinsonii (strain ATCC 33406 / DSM 1761 / CIP 103989 / NBRC 15051 / NCIMB 9469 / D465) TaxID=269798 RepID=A0A6N4SMP4_CYTH3|nr:TetR/AcrR family transcriptional regulator [Cytophaga hutchinsonii]ABG57544.1 transcriptional regulator, TetR family [Cytophaga hutchinsonii ATCC 33406]SFW99610.1 transcriptional regulator, TetR family [Cytophaga hutchinsonii ATCC 33406]
MSGRPKIFNEEEVINKAIDVFWKYGYEASSTEILLEAMGIGKSSFYLEFKGGKRELFERAMQQRSRLAVESLEKGFKEAGNKIDHLKSLFYSIADTKSVRHKNGCLLGNTIAELSNRESGLTDVAASLLLKLEQVFLKVIKECQANGTLKTKEKPEMLAKYLLSVWNGLNISVRVYSNKKVLIPLIEKQLEILQ